MLLLQLSEGIRDTQSCDVWFLLLRSSCIVPGPKPAETVLIWMIILESSVLRYLLPPERESEGHCLLLGEGHRYPKEVAELGKAVLFFKQCRLSFCYVAGLKYFRSLGKDMPRQLT